VREEDGPLSSERPEHPFLRTLRHALVEDAQQEIALAMRVGVLQAAGRSRGQIAEKLDASRSDLQAAHARLERAARNLNRGRG
jgi:hypothetical protein